jgi:hypothetical protein
MPDGAQKRVMQMAIGALAKLAATFCVMIDKVNDQGIEGAAELLNIEYEEDDDDEPGPEKLN